MEEVQKHVCGRCNDEWLTEAEYLAHNCTATGFNPTQAEHLGPEFAEVQKAALQRGMDLVDPADEVAVAKQQEAIDQLSSN